MCACVYTCNFFQNTKKQSIVTQYSKVCCMHIHFPLFWLKMKFKKNIYLFFFLVSLVKEKKT